jgi:hypothetical protein
MQRDEERRKFLQDHPWWGEIEGYQREIIRRFICCEEPRDAAIQAGLVESFVFTAGDILGKEVIWPILQHLLQGEGFHAEGMEIGPLRPRTQPSPSTSFLEFLSRHAPAGTGAGRIEVVRLLLKAAKRLRQMVEQTRQDSQELAKESADWPSAAHEPDSL